MTTTDPNKQTEIGREKDDMTEEPEELTKEERQAVERETRLESMEMLIDFLRENPIIPLPSWKYSASFSWKNDDLKEVVRAMSPCKKEVTGSFYTLAVTIGDIKFTTNFNREDVCKKKVVGTREVPEVVYEAHTEDIVEWTCPDSLLGGE